MIQLDFDLFRLAARKYKKYPGNPEMVYHALCCILSDRVEQVDWGRFSADDWQILPPMAEAEGVAPLIYWKLKMQNGETKQGKNNGETDSTAIAQYLNAVQKQLAASYYKTAAYNAMLMRELQRVLHVFNNAGIEAIVLKGAALAQTVYENIALRPMGDVDLLVRRDYMKQAVQVLRELDYTVLIHNYARYHVVLHRRELALELHWDLIEGRQLPWWQHVQPIMKTGDEIPGYVLDSCWQALYLATHTFWQHQDGLRLLWIYDLFLVTRGFVPSDWERLEDDALALGWRDVLFQLTTALRVLLNAKVPKIERGRREGDALYVVSMADSVSRRFLKMWRVLNWPSRLHMIIQGLFPSSHYMRWRYDIRHSILLPLYYVYRWLDLFGSILQVND